VRSRMKAKHSARKVEFRIARDRARREDASTGPRGRGVTLTARARLATSQASMGPRPRGRGVELYGRGHKRKQFLLQWGRARAGAEF
jgi:hypothetical protein